MAGIGEDRCHLAVLAERCRGHGGDAGRVGDRLLERRQLRLGLGSVLGRVDREQERPARTGTERLAQLVVRDPLGGGLGLVAVVGLADAQPRDGEREHQHDRDAGGDRRPRTAGDELAPARERRRDLGVLGFLRHEPAAEGAHHDRKDRQRRHDHGADRERRAEAHLADERDAHHEQTGERHHHDQPGCDDGRAGRRRRARGGVLQAVAGRSLLPVAADDEQRVVDARAEAEHCCEHGREGREPERCRHRRQEDLPRRNTRQRADERRGHRRSGAKQQGQQHDRDEDADELADRRVLLGGQVDQDPAGLRLDLGFGRLARGDQRLAVRLVDLPLTEGVAHVDGGQSAVGGHLPAGRERVRDQRDAVEGADLCERALDRGPGRGIGDLALVDREHQRGVHAAERRRMGLEEVDGFL